MENIKNTAVEEMTIEQLEELLKNKQKKAKKEKESKKKGYESERNIIVGKMIGEAKDLQSVMLKSKALFLNSIETFKMKAQEYADIRSNSKGGFSIRSTDGNQKVVYVRTVRSEYDERASRAEELIKEFLLDTVKVRDRKAYIMISAILERTKEGKYSPELISRLNKVKNEFEDKRWLTALELFNESYNEVEVSYSIAFYEKNEQGKDEHINLSFSSLPVVLEPVEDKKE